MKKVKKTVAKAGRKVAKASKPIAAGAAVEIAELVIKHIRK